MFEDEETIRDIEMGRYDWFIARVTARKAGVDLFSTYLGGCAYLQAADFVTAGDHYEDMVHEALTGAKEVINLLSQ